MVSVSEYRQLVSVASAKPGKYGAKKTRFGGFVFDSKGEAARWGELLILERMSQISNLRRQVQFELAPSVTFAGEKRAKPPLFYTADFVYRENGAVVVEDFKGHITKDFQVRRHLMKWRYDIDIRITGKRS